MRLIDVDALEKAIDEWMPKTQEEFEKSSISPIENLTVSLLMTIEEQPTVDAVPVIRCRACRFWNEYPDQTALPYLHKCRMWNTKTSSIDYCARAERKEE